MLIGLTLPMSSLALLTTLVATPVVIARTSPARNVGSARRPPSTPRGTGITPLRWAAVAGGFSVLVVLLDIRFGRIPSALVQLLTIVALTLGASFLAMLHGRDRPRLESRLAVWLLAGTILWQAGLRIQLTGVTSADLAITALWTAIVVTAFELDRHINATMLILAATAAASYMVLAIVLGQAAIAPFAGAVTGFAGGLTVVVRRHGPERAPVGAGTSLAVLLAALSILSLSSTALMAPAHPIAMLLAMVAALLPVLTTAWATALDRLRNSPGAFVARKDDFITRLRLLGIGSPRAIAGIAGVGFAHGAVTAAAPFLPVRLMVGGFVALLLTYTFALRWILRRGQVTTESTYRGRTPKPERHVLPIAWGLLDEGLLLPGPWVRRSALIWSRRGATLPPHLWRTRVTRRSVELGRIGDVRAALVSLSTRRHATVRRGDRHDPSGSADIVVASRDHGRLLYLDTTAGTVLHRTKDAFVDEERLRIRADIFQYLRGPAVLGSIDGRSLLEELVEGQHFVDVSDEVRLLALSSLLLDVTALVLATSRPASPNYAVNKLHDSAFARIRATHRTVVAPSTTSLDNVAVTAHRDVAWIEPFPLVEVSFHMPWYGIAVRVADLSPGVREALEAGVFDRALDRLLALGGVSPDASRRSLDVMGELPWGSTVLDPGQSSGR